MRNTSENYCVLGAEDDTMDVDVKDDMEFGEAVNYLFEIAIKKRRRFNRCRKARDLRKDCLQKRFIKKPRDETEKILNERKEEGSKASVK